MQQLSASGLRFILVDSSCVEWNGAANVFSELWQLPAGRHVWMVSNVADDEDDFDEEAVGWGSEKVNSSLLLPSSSVL